VSEPFVIIITGIGTLVAILVIAAAVCWYWEYLDHHRS
jgi:hypothetical protein